VVGGVVVMGEREPVDPVADHGEQRRQQRERRGHRDRDDECGGVAQREPNAVQPREHCENHSYLLCLGLEIVPVFHVDEVLARALAEPLHAIEWTEADEHAAEARVPPGNPETGAAVRH